jgi:hypothetical protein
MAHIYNLSYVEGLWSEANLDKSMRPYQKETKDKGLET